MFKLGFLALAALLFTGPALAKPPVWIVRDADSEVLIFGAVHVLPPTEPTAHTASTINR